MTSLMGRTIFIREELHRAGSRISRLAALLTLGALLVIVYDYVSAFPFANSEVFINRCVDNLQIIQVVIGIVLINIAYIFVTLYLIPALDEKNKPVNPAIRDSDPLHWKIWGGIIGIIFWLEICLLICLIILIAVCFSTVMLSGAVTGYLSWSTSWAVLILALLPLEISLPILIPRIIDEHSPDRALALIILELTILVLFFTVLIGPIVTGIIMLGLYLYAKISPSLSGLHPRDAGGH
ncbi:hypothetical protein [Methanoregula sp.]|uniref:hypothetical protein n=1 Tax=Methanoregula sp. TaxID=2052170 RepID=UPI003564C6FA